MDCLQFRKYLDNYENLDDLQLKFLYEHAEVCEECRRELEFFNSIINTVASVPVPEMPADFIEQVNKRIDAEPAKKGFIYNFSIASKKYAAVAACIAIGLVVGLNRTDIEDKLNGTDDSGVIKSEVATAVPTALPVPETENVTQTPVAEESVPAETEKVSVPAVQPTVKSTVKATQKPTAKPIVEATVKPTVKPVVKAEVKYTEKPTANAALPTVPVQVQEIEKKPSEVKAHETNTDKPVSVAVATENIEKNYTIEREEYYVPENENVTVAVTAEPDVSSYSLATAEPETKYSYREQPTVTPAVSVAIADYLLVAAEDIDAVASILNDLGIARAHGLYMTQTNNFYELLARLGDRNINYDYSMKYTTGDKISFKILLK